VMTAGETGLPGLPVGELRTALTPDTSEIPDL